MDIISDLLDALTDPHLGEGKGADGDQAPHSAHPSLRLVKVSEPHRVMRDILTNLGLDPDVLDKEGRIG